jgi:hypothetical protein
MLGVYLNIRRDIQQDIKSYLKCLDSLRNIFYEEEIKTISDCVLCIRFEQADV